jgi:hypothetical protein
MDLQLLLRVLWRFRVIVGCGLVLAFALAFLSYVKVNPSGDPKLSYRENEQWESLSTLFVTSRGFPWGSIGNPAEQAAADAAAAADGAEPEEEVQGNALDPVHLTALAALYVRLATSDPVLKEMRKPPAKEGTLQAFPVESTDTGRGEPLPMVTLSAIGVSREQAVALAREHARAFVDYIEREQRRANIPLDERVVIEVVRQPGEPTLLQARKKTRPMVVFVAVMIAVMGLAFALENLRPAAPPRQEDEEDPLEQMAVLPYDEDLEAVPAARVRRSA